MAKKTPVAPVSVFFIYNLILEIFRLKLSAISVGHLGFLKICMLHHKSDHAPVTRFSMHINTRYFSLRVSHSALQFIV